MDEVNDLSLANWQRNLLSSLNQAFNLNLEISSLVNHLYCIKPFIWCKVKENDLILDKSYHSVKISSANIKPDGILGMADLNIGNQIGPLNEHCSMDGESHLLFSRCLYYVVGSIIRLNVEESSLEGVNSEISCKAKGKSLIQLSEKLDGVLHMTIIKWSPGEKLYSEFNVVITLTKGYVTGVSVSPVQQVQVQQFSLSEIIQSFRSSHDNEVLMHEKDVKEVGIDDEHLR